MAKSLSLKPLFKQTANGKIQTWQIQVVPLPDGTAELVTTYGLVGGKLREERELISEGKNLGHKNETTPLQQAHFDAESAWREKRDRKHYGLDPGANESAVKRSLAPMLAKVYKDHAKKIDWNSAFAQPKYNGYRCIAEKTNGEIILWSREGKNFQLPHIVEVLQSVMTDGQRIDGELYSHGLSINAIGSLVKKPREASAELDYIVYDSPEAAPFDARFHLVQQILKGLTLDRHHITSAKTVQLRREADLMTFQADCIEIGFEGAMLRWGEQDYQAGKRSDCLLKVKTFSDHEFLIVGVKEGKGPYKGMAIFECTTEAGHRFECTAPGTHADKRDFWDTRHVCIGKQLKVKFAEMTKTEAPVPFHPVALELIE